MSGMELLKESFPTLTDFYSNTEFLDCAYELEGDKIHEAYSERCTLQFISFKPEEHRVM